MNKNQKIVAISLGSILLAVGSCCTLGLLVPEDKSNKAPTDQVITQAPSATYSQTTTPTPTTTTSPKAKPSTTVPKTKPTTNKPTPTTNPTHTGTVTRGRFCASNEHYWYGVTADGSVLQCLDKNGWRWE